MPARYMNRLVKEALTGDAPPAQATFALLRDRAA